jgi:YD repeat-containing protein
MAKKLFLAACIAAMALTGCKKDPQPEPTPEPQTVSRLARTVHKNYLPSGQEVRAIASFTWENGNLIQELDSLISPFGAPVVVTENFFYENGNHVRTEESTGVWQHYFTYENGMLKTFVDIYRNDTLYFGEVTAYNANGNLEEVIYNTSPKMNKYHLTWDNDNVTQLVNYIIQPAEEADTVTYNMAYDGKQSVYTGLPLSYILMGNDEGYFLERISKHNVFDASYTYNYDEKDRLISKVKENDSTFYYYIEQTME